ncbi:MAG: DUF1501 domain-containing protein [Planctomycetota bacterium]
MNPIKRRSFLGQGIATGFGSLFGSQLCHALDRAGDQTKERPEAPFRRCLVLWMGGGPSQQDTFDPKPASARRSIPTSVNGLQFAETLPGLAERADELCVIRSVGSREGEHERATELLHTGFSPLPSFPRPSLGSMVSHSQTDPGFPRFVTLGGNGFGPAFLGSNHSPFVIEDIAGARNQLLGIDRKRNSLELLAAMNQRYPGNRLVESAQQRTTQIESVQRLLDTGFPDALRLESAENARRERYGNQVFGQRMLTAWRLLELGVPFVEAQLSGWDTHIDNGRRTEALCQQMEKPWLAIMDDLQQFGLWDDTLIVWMGEFGRTPQLNGAGGRDHFPEITPVVLAGGSLGGSIVGQTNAEGSRREGKTHSVADLFATILQLMGLDTKQEYTTQFGSPTTVTDEGTPIALK